MFDWIKYLLKSRKFWLAVIGVIVTILQDTLGLEPYVVENIKEILIYLIGFIAVEDAARHLAMRK